MTDSENGADDAPLVFVITGKVRRSGETEKHPFNAVLRAADDDSAVRACLEALAQQGHEEADLDQIGNVAERPEAGEFADAYDAALGGHVALVIFDPSD